VIKKILTIVSFPLFYISFAALINSASNFGVFLAIVIAASYATMVYLNLVKDFVIDYQYSKILEENNKFLNESEKNK
jgi:integral membrane sensor domain MASE1